MLCPVLFIWPALRARRFGRIINVTTSYFTMLNPGFSPYGPAKSGLEAWSTSLAGELGGSGITVNVVVPGGPTDTPMVPDDGSMERSQLIRPEKMAPPMLSAINVARRQPNLIWSDVRQKTK